MTGDLGIPVHKYVSVANGRYRLHYHERGEQRADRPTLLFLHGSGPGASGYSNFRRNYEVMAQAGYHCIAVDYLGYGHSDKPAEFEYANTNQVILLEQMLDVLGIDQLVPIGNSLGGFIGFEYTLRNPARVPKLIGMAPGGVEDPALWIADSVGMQTMAAAVRKQDFNAENFRELLKLIVHDPVHLTDDVINERLPIAQSQPLEVFTTVRYSPLWGRLGEIACPVLGFWGYHDQFLPVSHAMTMQAVIPDCRMLLSNRAGHWFMIEEAGMFNAACLQFLAE